MTQKVAEMGRGKGDPARAEEAWEGRREAMSEIARGREFLETRKPVRRA